MKKRKLRKVTKRDSYVPRLLGRGVTIISLFMFLTVAVFEALSQMIEWIVLSENILSIVFQISLLYICVGWLVSLLIWLLSGKTHYEEI